MTDVLFWKWYSKRDSRVGIIKNLDVYLVPVICVVGVSGNALSFVVFYLKSTSTSIYLASLCIADACFLLAALVKWTEKTFMKLYTRDGW